MHFHQFSKCNVKYLFQMAAAPDRYHDSKNANYVQEFKAKMEQGDESARSLKAGMRRKAIR